jgi:hypothetical protein
VGFSFDHNCAWNLFGPQLSNPSSLYVHAMSAHNIVRLVDASCWPTTCGGKKMRQPSIFKITQQHTNNWEVDILLTQCLVFTFVDVPSLGYEQIYSILSNDQKYDVTIQNVLKCSCVYFVKMLVGSLVLVGCMCIINMCITYCRWSCSVGSWKSSFVIAHGVGMKFNVCWSTPKFLNSCDSILEFHSYTFM